MTQLVRQVHANGCGPATLAMLAVIPYAKACEQLSSYRDTPIDWTDGGCTHIDLDRALVEHGFWIQPNYSGWYRHPVEVEGEEYPNWEWNDGAVWPPDPWAPIHYATVQQPSGNAHFVVVPRGRRSARSAERPAAAALRVPRGTSRHGPPPARVSVYATPSFTQAPACGIGHRDSRRSVG